MSQFEECFFCRFQPSTNNPFADTIHMELECQPIIGQNIDDVIITAITMTPLLRNFNYLVSNTGPGTPTLCQLSLNDVDQYLNKSIKNCRSGLNDEAIISRHLSIGFQEPPSVSRRCSFYDMGKPLYLPALKPTFKSSIPFSLIDLKSASFQEREIFVGMKHDFEMVAFLTNPVYQKLSSQRLSSKTTFLVGNFQIITSSGSSDDILTFPLIDCASLQNCSSCLEKGASLCAWCLLKGSCELLSKCPDDDLPIESSQIAKNYSVQNCPFVENYIPSTIATRSANLINFAIQNLPHSDELASRGVSCNIPNKEIFGKTEVSTVSYQISRQGETSVKCIISIPELAETEIVPVELVYGATNVVLTGFGIPIDKCSRYSGTSCAQCVQNSAGCQWCPNTEKCSAFSNKTSLTDYCALRSLINPKLCPTILQVESPKTEFEVVEEIRLVVQASNAIEEIPINCRFQLRNWVFAVPATLIGRKSIYCDPIKLRFDETSINGITTYNVDVRQNMSLLENPNELKISIYDCTQMATTCSSCASLFARYKCAWCQVSLSCTTATSCLPDWTTSDQTQCREPPIISEFEPSSGPVAGGTELRIFGKNFGSNSDYIRNITIGPITCELKAVYLISNNLDSIICSTGESKLVFADRINVEVLNGMSGISNAVFEYKEPIVQHFHPKLGPKSGGTLVQIVGLNLDTGTNHFVNFETTQVQIHELTSYFVTFYTPALSTNESWVNLQIDGGIYHVGKYHFRPDPVITNYHPNFSISAGGINITFEGRNFNYITRAKITIHVQRMQSSTWFVYVNECSSIEETRIICATPTMEEIFPHVKVKIGLKLDGFEYLEKSKEFFIIPTPTFQTFDQVYLINEDSVIKFHGFNLSYNLQNSDFKVFMDKVKVCSSIHVDSAENFIECQVNIGENSPQITNSKPLLVQIQLGSNVLYSLGYVKLNQESSGIPTLVLFGVTISGLCFLATIAIIWYGYKICRVQELYIIK